MKKQAKLFCVFLLTAVLFIVSVEPVKAYAVWQDADAACPAYSFTGLSNSAVTHQTAAGKTAVLVFFRNTCPNSQSTVSALAQADWAANSGLAILAVNLEGASAAEVQSFAETYGDGGENIIFCTDPSAQVWSLLRAAGYSASSVTLPVTFVVDSSGRIRHYATGAVNEIAFESVLCSYVDGIETIPVHDVSVTGTFDYDEAYAVLEEINRQRAANQLPPLAMCGDLMEAAMQRAAECSLTYSHTRPNGGDCFSILPGIACGENIAVGFTSAAEVMEGWMNSPGHRSNILYDGYTTVGVGCFYQDSARYWTQTFGVDTPAECPAAGGKQKGSAAAEILEPNLELRLQVSEIALEAGESFPLEVFTQNIMYHPDSEFARTKLDASCLTFRSEDPSVASVSPQGVITGVACGETTVTASVGDRCVCAAVAVSETLRITAQPRDQEAANGYVFFTVGARGSHLTYQWQYRTAAGSTWYDSPFTGANTDTLSVKAEAHRNGYRYRCRISDGVTTIYSSAATLTVRPALRITGQPVSASVMVGRTAVFSVTAEGEGLSYLWQYRTSASGAWRTYSSTAGSSVSIAGKSYRDGYQYRCVVTDGYGGSVTSRAATLTVRPALRITGQPVSASAAVGRTAVFSVTAEGEGLSYLWQYRTSASGAWRTYSSTAGSSVSIAGKSYRDGYQYRCAVTDSYGKTVYSSGATLTVRLG